MTKQFKQIKRNESCRAVLPFEFAESDKVTIPKDIHLIPIGEWQHDMYGPIIINASDIKEFIQNFNAGIRKGVFITAGHEGWDELPAVGWVTKVEAHDDGLWGTVDWNEYGKGVLTDKQWKFFSPELVRDYEDPESHQLYRNVLTGGALTKSPYFKELQAIVFSDKNIKNNFNENTMNLKDLLAKDISTLTEEEKAFIIEHKAELTEEEKTLVTSIIDAPAEAGDTETEEEKTARIEKETGDANEAAGLNRDGSEKTPEQINASEKGNVVISASEYNALKVKADQGAQAFKELEEKELDTAVTALTFSESNKAGSFLPKSATKVRAFMESLNKTQRTSFSALIADLPKNLSFTEVGEGAGAGEGTAKAELDSKIEAKLGANKNMKYSEALKEVLSENAGLEQRFDSELVPVKKA